MDMTLHILGCGSAKPTTRHMPSSQLLELRGKYYMIDCGEGVQVTMQRLGLAMLKVGHIFISHNHGDHVFGLPGLISSMALLGRTAQLHIHAPQDVEPLVNLTLDMYCRSMEYEVVFHPVCTYEQYVVFQDRSVKVESIPLDHRVDCCGYLFRETQSLPHIRREMIDAFSIPVSQINNIKMGAGWTTPDGTYLPHERLTTPAAPAKSYAYCSDTRYMPQNVRIIEGVNLLYHEATFTRDDLDRALKTMHSTSVQAAAMASQAHVGQLLIGHYSARISDENVLLKEAKSVFKNTILAYEGQKIEVF